MHLAIGTSLVVMLVTALGQPTAVTITASSGGVTKTAQLTVTP